MFAVAAVGMICVLPAHARSSILATILRLAPAPIFGALWMGRRSAEQPMGYFQGSVIAALVETAGFYAMAIVVTWPEFRFANDMIVLNLIPSIAVALFVVAPIVWLFCRGDKRVNQTAIEPPRPSPESASRLGTTVTVGIALVLGLHIVHTSGKAIWYEQVAATVVSVEGDADLYRHMDLKNMADRYWSAVAQPWELLEPYPEASDSARADPPEPE